MMERQREIDAVVVIHGGSSGRRIEFWRASVYQKTERLWGLDVKVEEGVVTWIRVLN